FFTSIVLGKDSCSTWGGGHFSTFDKYQYDFTGTCNYIFATVCDETSPDFNIQFRRGLNKKIARIIIELGPSVITVEKGSISVRSVGIIKLPYTSNGIQIAPFGRNIRLVAKMMEMELVVMWNNDDYLMVSKLNIIVTTVFEPPSPVKLLKFIRRVTSNWILELNLYKKGNAVLTEKKYMGKTCGMCGNYDGQGLNDFMNEGKLLDTYKFAALQKMDDPSEICLSEEISISAIRHKKYVMICSQLLNLVSPTCSVPKEGFIVRCQLDMQDCIEPGQNNCTCSTLSEYSRQCAMSHQMVFNWRNENFCSVGKCSGNQIYEECGSPCIKTCSNPEYSCSSHCTYGCFCPEGTVLDDISKNRTCVHIKQCPCSLNGKVYAPGETMKAACRTCQCTMGQWNCIDLPCPGRCSLEGGSFVTTFDSRSYRFHGVCTYILMKSSSLPHSGTLMAVYGKSGYSHSETSLSAIIYLSTKDKIVISQNELLTDDDELKRLPYRSGDITIFKQSSVYIQMYTTFGLELVVQTSPVFQAYVKVGPQFKGRTLGLCGNYNGDTTDDFMTSMDINEGTASLFVDSWRAGNCQPALERDTDPCAMSQLNKISAETHCSILTKKGTVFEKCHAVVNPIPFYKRCVYQACNYEETFPYICSALGSYARTCSSMGLILESWRNSMDNCTITCTGNQTFSYNAQACDRTCLSLSNRALECHPADIPIEGCHCPKGTYLNHKNECVRKSHCPCYLEDRKYILPDQSTITGGITCYCVNGRLSCTGKPQNPAESCKAPKKYVSCSDSLENKYGATCAPTCQMLATGIECVPTRCESGCVCTNGLYENLDGRCVPAEECPCEYGGLAYGKDEQIQTECEICTCTRGKWKCVQKSRCSSTCNLYGEGHITTFDGQRFVFDGNCEYILAMDGCSVNKPVSSFKIVTENVICGKSGVTCSRSISIYLGNLTFILRDETFSVSGENPLVRYKVKKNVLHLMFDIVIPGKYNMTLIWNKHMNFFIKISRETQETICGLCGNYNGNMKDDFETRSKYVASNELEFVNSWKENPLCGDVYFVVDPCSKNPYRKAWAERTCSIINSQVFSACHNKVNRIPYYEACVRDSCGCDIGGDCECMCDAIAVYAMACLDKGLCIDWRTPEFCPVYCDYYNSHKKSGSEDSYSYDYSSDNCTWHYRPCNCPNQNYKYVNIEGCYNCSHDEYFDHEKGQCLPCVTTGSTSVPTSMTTLPTAPTTSAAIISTETSNPTITSKITRTSSALPLVTIKSTTVINLITHIIFSAPKEQTTSVFVTPAVTTTIATPSVTLSTKRAMTTKMQTTSTASSTTPSTETEKVRFTTLPITTSIRRKTTTSIPTHATSHIATFTKPKLTTLGQEVTWLQTLPLFSLSASQDSEGHISTFLVIAPQWKLSAESTACLMCTSFPAAVTHEKTTVPQVVPHLVTWKTTPATSTTSTSRTSVSRATSSKVPLTMTTQVPSTPPSTAASSTPLSTHAPFAAPSTVSTKSPTTTRPRPTLTTLTSTASPSTTSVSTETLPAESPATTTAKTSPLPSRASSPSSTLSSTPPSPSHPGKSSSCPPAALPALSTSHPPLPSSTSYRAFFVVWQCSSSHTFDAGPIWTWKEPEPSSHLAAGCIHCPQHLIISLCFCLSSYRCQSWCIFLPTAVTHKKTTVPLITTERTTPATSTTSTSRTSVSRATSSKVPLTMTTQVPSTLPSTAASSTLLSTHAPFAAPSTVSTKSPTTTRPKPTPTTLTSTASPSTTSFSTETLPAESSAPSTAKTSTLPSPASSPSSTLSSTSLSPSHPAVTHKKTSMQPVTTQRTSLATPTTSTFRTSVSKAMSPEVPLTMTTQVPSTPPSTVASSTPLSTHAPFAAPSTVSTKSPTTTRPKPTPTMLTSTASPSTTSVSTETLPAESSAPSTAKTSPLPLPTSSPSSTLSSTPLSPSHRSEFRSSSTHKETTVPPVTTWRTTPATSTTSTSRTSVSRATSPEPTPTTLTSTASPSTTSFSTETLPAESSAPSTAKTSPLPSPASSPSSTLSSIPLSLSHPGKSSSCPSAALPALTMFRACSPQQHIQKELIFCVALSCSPVPMALGLLGLGRVLNMALILLQTASSAFDPSGPFSGPQISERERSMSSVESRTGPSPFHLEGVTHILWTALHSALTTVPPLTTERTTPTTSTTSTSKTSVSRATSPEVPLTTTTQVPSTPLSTTASSTPLSTHAPFAAPSTVSTKSPTTTRPKPTPTMLTSTASPSTTSFSTETLPAESPATTTVKTSPLPSSASFPTSTLSSTPLSPSHPGKSGSCPPAALPALSTSWLPLLSCTCHRTTMPPVPTRRTTPATSTTSTSKTSVSRVPSPEVPLSVTTQVLSTPPSTAASSTPLSTHAPFATPSTISTKSPTTTRPSPTSTTLPPSTLMFRTSTTSFSSTSNTTSSSTSHIRTSSILIPTSISAKSTPVVIPSVLPTTVTFAPTVVFTSASTEIPYVERTSLQTTTATTTRTTSFPSFTSKLTTSSAPARSITMPPVVFKEKTKHLLLSSIFASFSSESSMQNLLSNTYGFLGHTEASYEVHSLIPVRSTNKELIAALNSNKINGKQNTMLIQLRICREVEYEDKITYKGCSTNITLVRCEGSCPSSAKLNVENMMVNTVCGCCMPLTLQKKELQLPCHDPDNPGKRLITEITVFGGCVCDFDSCIH
ncbi:MUC6 protein, partial [Nothocercus nigrocapillus]|nr:MUC6 protein [Nothocercus nigrocapillus]